MKLIACAVIVLIATLLVLAGIVGNGRDRDREAHRGE